MASGARLREYLMAKSAQKVTLSPSRDIPFDKLVLSQSNVRRIKTGISVEELAEDIARRRLLQSLSVRPVLADDGSEAGKFEIPAGCLRFQALSLLVKQKSLANTTPIPCIVRDAKSVILAENDSLAENMQRAALHPLDQFRAFVALREKGQGDEEIAAAFFVTPQVDSHASAFFGRVPVSVLYDNDSCMVAKILADGTRQRVPVPLPVPRPLWPPRQGERQGQRARIGRLLPPQLHDPGPAVCELGFVQRLLGGAVAQTSGGCVVKPLRNGHPADRVYVSGPGLRAALQLRKIVVGWVLMVWLRMDGAHVKVLEFA